MRQTNTAKSIANRNCVSKYLDHQDINTLHQLPLKEKIPHFNSMKKRDRKAMNNMVAENHRYVVCVAKRFQNNGLTLHELIIQGNLGLVKAVENFDEETGFSLISYAIWCIRRSILKAFMEDLKDKPIPLNRIGMIPKSNRLFYKLEQYCEREPESKDIEGMQEFQAKIMKDALQATSNQMSSNCYSFK